MSEDHMDVIHFTQGATDPLNAFDSIGVRFLPLADGQGDTHVSCAHLNPGAEIQAPSLTHAAALLVVHGRITVTTPEARIDIHAGMGCVFEKGEPYSLRSDAGAILIILESDQLVTNRRGVSTPERIAGQTWPSDTVLT
jgi:mannose-6-phosphate isomerase-like protein (cupin superfamily)